MGTRLAFAGLIVLAVFASVGPLPASSVDQAPAQPLALRVAVHPIAPFVLKQGSQLSGFSIDLWEALARRLNVGTSWAEVNSLSEQLQAVNRADADLAIGAITITPEREEIVDFSHPYFDSGLQIMVRAQTESPWWDTIRSIPWLAIGQLIGAAIVIMFLLANVLWLVEHRSNPNFQKGYLRGIGEGLWGAMLIVATGEHGDRDARRVRARFTAPGKAGGRLGAS